MNCAFPHLDRIEYLPPMFGGTKIRLVFDVEGASRSALVSRDVFRNWAKLQEAICEQAGIDTSGNTLGATADEFAMAWEKVAEDELAMNARKN